MKMNTRARITAALSAALLFTTAALSAPQTISFTWSSDGDPIYFLLVSSGGAFTVDWGNGSSTPQPPGTGSPQTIPIYYATPGDYTVTITGDTDACLFTVLNCSGHGLTALDVSGCTSLIELNCSDNQLTVLDVSANTELQSLRCNDNQLTSLVLGANTELVWCHNNSLPLSDLFAASQRITNPSNKRLGTQNLPPETIEQGVAYGAGQNVFDGTYTTYPTVLKDGSPAAEGTDYTISDGMITFNTTGNYTVTMVNAAIVSDASYPAQVIATIEVTGGATFIPVTNITGVPSTATATFPLNLTGTVAPSTATHQTIIWDIKDAGATGATISGNTLTTTAAGTVTVTATITDGTAVGTDYTKDFNITVNAFVPVTGITISSDTATAETEFDFTLVASPANASMKRASWNVKDAGTTGGITSFTETLGYVYVDGQLVLVMEWSVVIASAGTLVITATIPNGVAYGVDYTQDFTITVSPAPVVPVTNITGVPTSATTMIPRTLTGTVAPANATHQDIVWSVKDAGATGATITGNTLTTTAAGTVTVTATIIDGLGEGEDYTKDFPILIHTTAIEDGNTYYSDLYVVQIIGEGDMTYTRNYLYTPAMVFSEELLLQLALVLGPQAELLSDAIISELAAKYWKGDFDVADWTQIDWLMNPRALLNNTTVAPGTAVAYDFKETATTVYNWVTSQSIVTSFVYLDAVIIPTTTIYNNYDNVTVHIITLTKTIGDPDPYLTDPGSMDIPPATLTSAYDGFVYDDAGTVLGTLTLNAKAAVKKVTDKATKEVSFTTNWTFSAKAVLQASSVSFSGKWTNGFESVTLQSKKNEFLTVGPGTNTFYGTFTDAANNTFNVAGARNIFADKKGKPATETLPPLMGLYNIALLGRQDDAPLGYVSLSVGKAGAVKLAGQLSDGTKVSGSAKLLAGLNEDGWYAVALHRPLYSKKGFIGGLLWLDPIEKVIRVDTFYDWFVDWVRAETDPKKTGLNFTRELDVLGGWFGDGRETPKPPDGLTFSASVPDDLPSPLKNLDGDRWMDEAFPSGLRVNYGTAGKLWLDKGDTPKVPKGGAAYEYGGDNPSTATLTYTPKTGVFKGAFKIYYDGWNTGDKLQHKAVSVSYTGVMVPDNGELRGLGIGTATIDKVKYGMPVFLEK